MCFDSKRCFHLSKQTHKKLFLVIAYPTIFTHIIQSYPKHNWNMDRKMFSNSQMAQRNSIMNFIFFEFVVCVQQTQHNHTNTTQSRSIKLVPLAKSTRAWLQTSVEREKWQIESLGTRPRVEIKKKKNCIFSWLCSLSQTLEQTQNSFFPQNYYTHFWITNNKQKNQFINCQCKYGICLSTRTIVIGIGNVKRKQFTVTQLIQRQKQHNHIDNHCHCCCCCWNSDASSFILCLCRSPAYPKYHIFLWAGCVRSNHRRFAHCDRSD